MIDAEALKRRLNLVPLPFEGGYFAETYRSTLMTAIYYLLTPDTCSRMHRLKSDELYHFYLGDPVEMLLLHPHGEQRVVLGPDLEAGMEVQHLVPSGVWQGSRLAEGGRFALLGTNVAPPFELADFVLGGRDELFALYPWVGEEIIRLTSP